MLRIQAQRLRTFAAPLAIGLALFSPASHALDLPLLMERSTTATEASVVLVPPMSIYRTDLTEVGMRQEGCRYVTFDPEALRSLIALVRSADVRVSPVYQRPDMREGVYLVLGDGSRLNFFLQDNNGGRLPVQGVVEASSSGDLQSTAITAAPTLATDLRTWAATHGGAGEGAACNRKPLPENGPEALPVALPR